MRESETTSFYRRRLPHWSVKDGVYFVTIRQKDSIPAAAAKLIRTKTLELQNYPENEQVIVRRKIFAEMEKWLELNCAEGVLTNNIAVGIINEAINFRAENGIWRMVEYVVMPNHVHLFLSIKKGTLKTILSGFKRKTSKDINVALGRDGSLWQCEWFDHWSRSAEEDEKIIKYIRNNPVKAGLVKDYRDWPHGSWDCGD